MSPVANKFFTASVIYLILGLLSQAVALFDVWLGFNPLAYTAVAATEQTLLVGWLTQLALAFIYNRWLAPGQTDLEPISKAQSSRNRPRDPQPADPPLTSRVPGPTSPMAVFVLFNVGLPFVIIGQPGLVLFGGQWLGAAAAFGGLLQLFAGLIFVSDVWRTFKR